MNIEGGYILQPRRFDESDCSKMPPVVRELWFYLLRKVNHKPRANYARGQGFFSLSDIQTDLSWYVGYRKMIYSKPQLTKSLRRLRESNAITTTKATRGVIVTICKYDYYQEPKNYEGNAKKATKDLRRKRQGITKNKNVKKEEVKHSANGAGFETFWNAFNDKRGKSKAELSFKKAIKTTLINDIVLGAKKYAIQREAILSRGGTPKMAQGWLTDRRWEDEIETGCKSNSPSGTCDLCKHISGCNGKTIKSPACSRYEGGVAL